MNEAEKNSLEAMQICLQLMSTKDIAEEQEAEFDAHENGHKTRHVCSARTYFTPGLGYTAKYIPLCFSWTKVFYHVTCSHYHFEIFLPN